MRYKYLLLGLMSVCLTACFDLNQQPQGVLSTSAPFRTSGEIKNYVNTFYETCVNHQGFMSGGGSGIAGNDINSDNMATSQPNTRLNGGISLSRAQNLSRYHQIRNINFLLNNAGDCTDKGTPTYNQLIGEAYFFRAWLYFDLLKNYGPVSWVDKPLNPDLKELQLPRDSRTVVADHILADLDQAISLLREQNTCGTMRVHKDVARAFKSEVALFEATWEKYHFLQEQNSSSKFYDTTIPAEALQNKIKDYLAQAIKAADDVCKRGVWQVYNTGKTNEDYRQMFCTTNLNNNKEILWYKLYDGDQVGNSVTRYLNTGGGIIGITASLADDYLTIDGKPFVGDMALQLKKTYPNELLPTNRDPRLAQTLAAPGQRMQPLSNSNPYTVSIPKLAGDNTAFGTNTTGYIMLKHVQIDYTGDYSNEYKGSTPSIQVRYADVLLNYAEALAEQNGEANQNKIKEVLLPLRQRVGMPGVDFDREYNTDSSYPFNTLDKYIQAVRRERRVEQALEGKRFMDILRWAAADELIVGKSPKGILFKGSNLEDKYQGKLTEGKNFFLTGAASDEYRYVLPMDPVKALPGGFQFKVDRDYLLPIQERMLTLTNNLWTQNPGW